MLPRENKLLFRKLQLTIKINDWKRKKQSFTLYGRNDFNADFQACFFLFQ